MCKNFIDIYFYSNSSRLKASTFTLYPCNNYTHKVFIIEYKKKPDGCISRSLFFRFKKS